MPETPVAAGQGPAQGRRAGVQGEQQGFPAPADAHGLVEQGKNRSARVSRSDRSGAGDASVRSGHLTNPPVHVRPVRFEHRSSAKTERIVAVPVMHAERRNQPGRDHGRGPSPARTTA